ncbi:MAG TPA: YeeE/YedE thiosulfate transporter family protein [Planctomycetota bacterium]
MNLFAQDLLNGPFGLLAALAIGGAFGFWLERAGFGSSRKLTAIFYLQDFAVLKVMFTAMATAAVSLAALAGLGAVDLGALFVPPTAVWPQLAGGALFGIGFVAGGWCPGTAAVGVASGKGDALVFLVGAGAGSLAFAALEPRLRGFLHGGEQPVCSLPESIGLGALPGAVVLLVIAVAASLAATRVERLVARRNP